MSAARQVKSDNQIKPVSGTAKRDASCGQGDPMVLRKDKVEIGNSGLDPDLLSECTNGTRVPLTIEQSCLYK